MSYREGRGPMWGAPAFFMPWFAGWAARLSPYTWSVTGGENVSTAVSIKTTSGGYTVKSLCKALME